MLCISYVSLLHRANNKKWTIQYLLHCVGENTFVKCMDADALMKILILFGLKKKIVFLKMYKISITTDRR